MAMARDRHADSGGGGGGGGRGGGGDAAEAAGRHVASAGDRHPHAPGRRRIVDDRVGCCTLRRYNVLVLSFALMLLFTAFNTLQSWLTNLFSTLGNQLLTALYISVCVSLFVTPPLVHYLSHRRSILLGAVCYVIFIASLIHVETASTMIASIVNGFGASVLWVAVGGFLTRCSEDHERGSSTGLFWCIFQLSSIIGNVLAWLVINRLSTIWLFIIFTSIAIAGTLLLLFLRPFADSPSRKSSFSSSPSSSSSPSPSLLVPSIQAGVPIIVQSSSSSSSSSSNVTADAASGGAPLVVVTTDLLSDHDVQRQVRHAAARPRGRDNFDADSEPESGDESEEFARRSNGSGRYGNSAGNVDDDEEVYAPMSEQGVVDVPNPPLLHVAERPTVRSLLRSLVHVVRYSSIALMFPAFVFQGIEFSFWNGEYPNFYDQSVLGLVLLWAGVGEAVGGMVMGTLSDRVGRSVTWVLGILLYFLSLDAVYLIKSNAPIASALQFQGVPMLACAAALCFGLADSAFNTQIYALLGSKFKKDHDEAHGGEAHGDEAYSASNRELLRRARADDAGAGETAAAATAAVVKPSHVDDRYVVAAFTCFNFFQNIGAAFGFFYQPSFPVHGDSGTYTQVWVGIAFAVVSTIGFVACDRNWFPHMDTLDEVDMERARASAPSRHAAMTTSATPAPSSTSSSSSSLRWNNKTNGVDDEQHLANGFSSWQEYERAAASAAAKYM